MRPPPAQPADATNVIAPDNATQQQRVALGGDVLRRLHAALLDAFSLASLRQLFLLELNRPLETVVATEGRTLDAVVADAVRWALGAPGVGLHGLLDAARRANPTHSGLAQLAAEWRGAVFVRPACPYPGMRPFTEDEAGRFFGRAPEVRRALEALRLHPVLCVIGPSGSGKSSLAFAGVVPALRASTLFPGARWTVAALRPGSDPAAALEAAVLQFDPVDDRRGDPRGRPEAGGHEARPYDGRSPDGKTRRLLVIDQAEELFTLAGAEQRRAFEDALLRLAQRDDTAILLTVRSDYYTDLLTSRLWPLLRERLLDVAPLRGDALRDAIAHPAADVGVTVDPALAERLLADAGDEAGVLPFIQETMVLLWDQAQGFTLTLDAYAAAVGARTGQSALQVALGGRADAAYLALDEEGRRLARRTFLRLIQFGEGRRNVRRQQCAADLAAAGDDPAARARVLDALVAARLLTAGSNAAGERTYDLAHEALLVGWARLAAWADERKEAETARRRLEEKAAEWLRLGSGEGALLDAAELAEASTFLRGPDAADLGVSETLERHVAASRHAANPGWQMRGALLLAGAALALALLAGVGVNALLGSALQGSAVVTIGVAAVMLALIALVALWLLRRADRHMLQRWSHGLAERPRRGLAVGALVAVALAVLGTTTVAQARLEQACSAVGLLPQGGNQVVAVTAPADDPTLTTGEAQLFAYRFDYWSAGSVKAAAVTPADVLRCQRFISNHVQLRSSPLPATPGTSARREFHVEFMRPGQSSPYDLLPRQGDLACTTLLELPQEVLVRANLIAETQGFPSLTREPVPCSAAQAYAEAKRALNNGNYDLAVARLREAIALFPSYADAYSDLGLTLTQTGRANEALAAFQQALALVEAAGNAPIARSLLLTHKAVACFRLNDLTCAAESAEEVIALREFPRHVALAFHQLHLVYREQNKLDEAASALDRFAAYVAYVGENGLREDWIALHKNRGILAYRAGEWAKAREQLELADSGQLPETREAVRFWFISINSGHPAQPNFAVAARKHNEEIVYYLAAVALEEGRSADACELWQRYTAIPPSYLQGEEERREQARRTFTGLCA